ncbi:MAG: hypothetical protein N3A60_04060 [Thermanaerothrix sp.]|nr:hypothetical protein [Thermanaerothrix sp.]
MGKIRIKCCILIAIAWVLVAFAPPPNVTHNSPEDLPRRVISFAQPNPTSTSASSPAATTPNDGNTQPVYVLYSTALTCNEIWGIRQRPPYIPPILEPSVSLAELNTNTPYYYLVAMLIRNKVVDARDCPGQGLQTPYVANVCGVERARSVLAEWQNMYDAEIIQASQNTGIPPRLLKQLFAIESQFWPGTYGNGYEIGLGQLNQSGADTLLLYNSPFFQRLCNGILHPNRCELGYANLSSEERTMLRGYLVQRVNATCADCPAGIDVTRAKESVAIFAEVLRANCAQTAQIIYNVYRQSPSRVSNYVDLWKITLVNYHTGPGCTSKAVQYVNQNSLSLSWESLKSGLIGPECKKGSDYIERIFQ